MQWKQFPSHCLLAMDGEKKLSSVWKPRLTDPFSSDLLPTMDKPELLSGPQPDDFADLERYTSEHYNNYVCITVMVLCTGMCACT